MLGRWCAFLVRSYYESRRTAQIQDGTGVAKPFRLGCLDVATRLRSGSGCLWVAIRLRSHPFNYNPKKRASAGHAGPLFGFPSRMTRRRASTLPWAWRGLNDDIRRCRPASERNARGGTAAGPLRRITPAGGGVDRSPAAGPDAPIHRPGPRGLSETGPQTRPRLGEQGAISSGRRRRPCGRSSSIRRAARPASNTAAHGQRVELAEGLAVIEPPADDMLALDEAIQRLSRPRSRAWPRSCCSATSRG